MRKVLLFLPRSILLLSIVILLSCGSSNRELQSISVSPAAANGQAQFVATGTYTDGSKVSPLTALWSPGNPWVMSQLVPAAISVDAHGIASCLTRSGTFTIDATAPVNPQIPVSQMGPTTPQVSGTAQITCP
jgi:hypothetical protein